MIEALTPSIVRFVVRPSSVRPGVWLSCDHRDEVRIHESADAVLAFVQRRDARRAGFAVTVIEWENVPDGFVPPEVSS